MVCSESYRCASALYCPDVFHLCCGKEATARAEYGVIEWFSIGKDVRLGCNLSLHLFSQYTEHIQKAELGSPAYYQSLMQGGGNRRLSWLFSGVTVLRETPYRTQWSAKKKIQFPGSAMSPLLLLFFTLTKAMVPNLRTPWCSWITTPRNSGQHSLW